MGTVRLAHLSGEIYEFTGVATFVKGGGCFYFFSDGTFLGTRNGEQESVNIGIETEFTCGPHVPAHSCHGSSDDDYWQMYFSAGMNGQSIILRWTGGMVTEGQECMPGVYSFCSGSEDESLWTVLLAGDVAVT